MNRLSSPTHAIRALAALTVAATLLCPTSSEAGTTVSTPEDGRYCALSADIHRWGPGDGPPARFIAERFARGTREAWIGLGYTAAGFWSAESAAASDACDSCETLDLVLTRADGTRRRFPVLTSTEVDRLQGSPPEALRDLALKRLWRVAASDWRVGDLKQDYALRLPPTLKPDGTADPYPGWMAEVSRRGSWRLRFAQQGTKTMCWCSFEWRGWALAAPRSK